MKDSDFGDTRQCVPASGAPEKANIIVLLQDGQQNGDEGYRVRAPQHCARGRTGSIERRLLCVTVAHSKCCALNRAPNPQSSILKDDFPGTPAFAAFK